jgi:multidrug efflux system outer membrane protein
MKSFKQLACAAAVLTLLAGCATVSPDGGLGDVQTLTQGKTAGVDAALSRGPTPEGDKAIAGLLAQPVSEASAVRIAMLNNPGLHASLATLGLADADRVQMGSLPNPTLALGRMTQGDTVELERVLRFDVIGLLTLPWRSQWAGRQTELAKLQAAQEVVKLAADTRKAWINAVAAQQTARYMRDVKEAAEAGAELARRLAKVGNWSRLNQAREQVFLVDATAQLARAEQSAFSSREQLTRPTTSCPSACPTFPK